MVGKTLHLQEEGIRLLNLVKSKLLKQDPSRSKLTDSQAVEEALKGYLK